MAKFINISERYGERVPVTIADYEDLNPDGTFEIIAGTIREYDEEGNYIETVAREAEITPADYAAVEAMGETAENVFSDDASETMPEAVGGFERPCEHCGGSGHITMHGLYIVMCDECDGTGIHTEPEPVETDALRAEVQLLNAQLEGYKSEVAGLRRTLDRSDANTARLQQQLAAARDLLEAFARSGIGSHNHFHMATIAAARLEYIDSLNK